MWASSLRATRHSSRLVAGAALLAILLPLGLSREQDARSATGDMCGEHAPSLVSERTILATLADTRDVWGQRLLAEPGGPSEAAVRALLPPLFYARSAHRQPLTASGAYYIPLADDVGRLGAGTVTLALADGSQLIAGHVGGASLSLSVGAGGFERYGSCRARLATPRLADGYLPILETGYVDAAGVVYRQESFAARESGVRGLVSFERLEISTRQAKHPVQVTFTLTAPGLGRVGDRLVRAGRTYLLFSSGARFRGSMLVYAFKPGHRYTLELAYLDRPEATPPLPSLTRFYDAARTAEVAYWRRRLAAGASITVPDVTLDDAERALLIQDLLLGYRYSVGNAYQEFSFPETIDVARVMGEWGYPGTDRAIVDLSLSRPATPYPNWTRGEQLVAAAEYAALFHDRRFVAEITPTLTHFVAIIRRELSPVSELLPAEQYSSDIHERVIGLPAQTVVWQGLEDCARMWRLNGELRLAGLAARLASRLHAGLSRAVARSSRRLPDGSLFVPVILLGHEQPYESLTRTRLGSYWNLDMPYALASGFFRPGSRTAAGILPT